MTPLISEEQRRLNQALHARNSDFGNRADGAGLAANLPDALLHMHHRGACASVLDYGTGKGKLVHYLRQKLPQSIEVEGYDPAVEDWRNKPKGSFDIVTCLDVLEHVEVENVDDILRDIRRLSRCFCFLIIDLQLAAKSLPDGRNAHILLAPPEWWIARVSQVFPSMASFPVLHISGHPQKLVITAATHGSVTPLMYAFLCRLNIFSVKMTGGSLGSSAQGQGASVRP